MKSNNIEPHSIKITKELLTSVERARTRYGIALEERKGKVGKRTGFEKETD